MINFIFITYSREKTLSLYSILYSNLYLDSVIKRYVRGVLKRENSQDRKKEHRRYSYKIYMKNFEKFVAE